VFIRSNPPGKSLNLVPPRPRPQPAARPAPTRPEAAPASDPRAGLKNVSDDLARVLQALSAGFVTEPPTASDVPLEPGRPAELTSTALPTEEGHEAPGLDDPLGELVTEGTITINDQSVAISPDDTLRGVAAKLDALDGVQASLTVEGRLALSSEPAGALTINDSSGLLAALQIPNGTVRGQEPRVGRQEVPGGEKLEDPAGAATDLQSALRRVNERLTAAFDDGAPELQRDLRATLSAQAETLEGSSERAVRLADGPVPQMQVDAERLEGLLALVRSPAELSGFLSGMAGVAQALPAVAARSEQADAAAERADDLRTGTVRDGVQLSPGVAAGVDRLAAQRVSSLLDSATSDQTDDDEKRRPPMVVTEKARQAYGLPRPAEAPSAED
jgi:hypothetical protein